MPSAILLILYRREDPWEISMEVVNDLLPLMTDDDHNMARIRRHDCRQHVTEQRSTENGMQNLRHVRFHSSARASGEDNDETGPNIAIS